ncbi:hypothetical protein EK21DRAFT_95071 [Setomelanomma holmii]|uniref:C3H1-type domain-containing protein n=1 Tax=Setomelanomma holmii TaxID=210430 RepID=A0A9P4GV15_9PLEO|nr:hypothetical protein EK21DRAFT_95071 [Setomelanomma holmii]
MSNMSNTPPTSSRSRRSRRDTSSSSPINTSVRSTLTTSTAATPTSATASRFASAIHSAKRKHDESSSDTAPDQSPGTTRTPDLPVEKKIRLDDDVYDLQRAAKMCLDAECARRNEQGLAALNEEEKQDVVEAFSKLSPSDHSNITFEQIAKAGPALRLLIRDSETDKEQRHYLAALLTSQVIRVRQELNNIESYLLSREKLNGQDLGHLTKPINRVYLYLSNDPHWRGVIPYLGLLTPELWHILDQIQSPAQPPHDSDLATKAKRIQQLLTPGIESDATDTAVPEASIASNAVNAGQGFKKQDTLFDEDDLAVTYEDTFDPKYLLEREKQLRVEAETRAVQKAKALEHKITAYNENKESHEKMVTAIKQQSEEELANVIEKYKRDMAALQEQCNEKIASREAALEKELNEKWQIKLTHQAEEDKRKAEEIASKSEQAKRRAAQEAAEAIREQEAEAKARRDELLAVMKKHQNGIQTIIYRFNDHTQDLLTDKDIPTKQFCLQRLTDLWESKGASIIGMHPHTLWNDDNLALEFEVDTLLVAQVCMTSLLVWDCEPNELLATNWNHAAMLRLQHSLESYHENSKLSSMSKTVVVICSHLQQAIGARDAAHAPTVPSNQQPVFNTSFGSSSGTQPSIFDQSFGSSIGTQATAAFPSHPTAPQGNLAAPDNTIDSSTNLASATQFFAARPNGFNAPLPTMAEANQVDEMSIDGPERNDAFRQHGILNGFGNGSSNVAHGQSGAAEACRNFAKGKCYRSDHCPYSHDPAFLQQAPSTAQHAPDPAQSQGATAQSVSMANGNDQRQPCRFMVDGRICNYGDDCRFSHDLQAIQKAQLARPHTPCPNFSKWGPCRRQDCPYLHNPGEHQSTRRVSNAPLGTFNGRIDPSSIPATFFGTSDQPQIDASGDSAMSDAAPGPRVDHRSTKPCFNAPSMAHHQTTTSPTTIHSNPAASLKATRLSTSNPRLTPAPSSAPAHFHQALVAAAIIADAAVVMDADAVA